MTRLTEVLTVVCGLALAGCGGKDKAGEQDVPSGTVDAMEVVGADGDTRTGDVLGPDACVPCCEESELYPWTRECGDDCCGGSCGECSGNSFCTDAGYGHMVCFSYDECPGFCAGRGNECGESYPFWEAEETMDPVVCECGPCPEGHVCVGGGEDNHCCVPDCGVSDLMPGCGDDGCGGICTCPDEEDVCLEWDYEPKEGPAGFCWNPDKVCPSTCYEGNCGLAVAVITPEGDATCNCGECPEGQVCIHGEMEGLCCQPDCTGKACGDDDGCGGTCGECSVECTTHGQCGEGQLCLGEPEAWEPKEVCGFCGDVEDCHCAAPDWPDQYHCATDADCKQVFSCGDQCDDCPVTCPKCVHGWCAYQTFQMVMCICPSCA